MGRQGLVQARNLVSVQHGAGWLLGLAKKITGFICERGQQAIDTGRQIFFRHFDWRTGGAAGQLVNQKSVRCVQHFVARPQIGLRQRLKISSEPLPQTMRAASSPLTSASFCAKRAPPSG